MRAALLVPVLSLALALTAGGCGGGDDTASKATPFDYDADAPLAAKDGGVVSEENGLVVRDVSFAVPGGRVEALLIAPRDAKRLPAVVYIHGAGGDRTSLTIPAAWLAARGAVALALTQPSTRSQEPTDTFDQRLESLHASQVADVVAVRRAADFLASRPEVDPDRIGLVGWSAGARTGGIVGGVDDRLKALVLMSGGASPVDEYVAAAPEEAQADVERVFTDIDPLRWLAAAEPRRLIQNARQDQVVPQAALEHFARAAKGADVRWYDADHALGVVEAQTDQLDWLTDELEIDGPEAAGAPTGP